ARPTSAVVTGSGAAYTVAVSGMSKSGTVTVSIPANVVVDSTNNPNTASTSTDNTVTFTGVVDTVGVFDPATANWYLRNSNSAGGANLLFAFGAPNWLPVAGDWNGDGRTTVGVVDPSTHTWYLTNSNATGAPDIAPFVFGSPGSVPLVGDWDG